MAKKRDPFTRFSLKCDENGVWYAHDNWYPYIGHPDSWGTKERAQNYIAGEQGISWEEYQAVKYGKSTRNQPKRRSPMSDRDKLTDIVCGAMQDQCVEHCNHSPCFCVEKVVDAMLANGVTVQEPAKKAEDCRYYTANSFWGAGCLGTKEIDPCKGDGCERWKPKEE